MKDRPLIDSEIQAKLKLLKRGTLGREWVEWCERGNVTPDTRAPVSRRASDSRLVAVYP